MSEIERAIEYFEKKLADGDRTSKNYVGIYAEEAKKEWLEVGRPIGETTLRVLRAELDREKNPMTCDGCVSENIKAQCRTCIRCEKPRPDYYVQRYGYEPKGEKA